MKPQITVVLGSGAIAVAITRRVSIGKHVLLADLRLENTEKAAQTLPKRALNAARYDGNGRIEPRIGAGGCR